MIDLQQWYEHGKKIEDLGERKIFYQRALTEYRDDTEMDLPWEEASKIVEAYESMSDDDRLSRNQEDNDIDNSNKKYEKIIADDVDDLEVKISRINSAPVNNTIKPIKLASFIEEYLRCMPATFTHGKNTTRNVKSILKMFLDSMGDVELHTITAKQAADYIASRGSAGGNKRSNERLSPNTLKGNIRDLKAAFNVAVVWGNTKVNPFANVKKPRFVASDAPQHFSREEFAKILSVVDDERYKQIFIFACHTGLRLCELTNLEWNDVSEDRTIIRVHKKREWTPKTGKPRFVGLTPEAQAALKFWDLNRDRERIFHFRTGLDSDGSCISDNFTRYLKMCPDVNQKLTFHDLRHTFASWGAEAGIHVNSMYRMTGHSSLSEFEKTYWHQDVNALPRHAETFSRYATKGAANGQFARRNAA